MNKGRRHTHAPCKRLTGVDWTAGVGLGLAIAAAVSLFYRSAPVALSLGLVSAKPFAMGIALGVFLAGLSFSLFNAKDGFRDRPSRGSRAPAWIGLACSVAGALVFAVRPGPSVSIGSMPVEASGVVVGVGFSLVFFAWLERCRSIEEPHFFPTVSSALFVCGVACGLVSALPLRGALALSGAFLLAATVLCAHAPLKRSDEAAEKRDDAKAASRAAEGGLGEPPSILERVRRAAALVWKPLLGTCICAFVIGFTWDTDLLGVPLNNPAMLASEKVVGFAVSAVLLLALAGTRPRDRIEPVLLYVVLPFALFSFIVRPYFLGSDLPPAALMAIGVVREMGFALFFTAAWFALCSAPKASLLSPGFLFGVFASLCSLSLLLGFGGAYVLGSAINMAGAILFVAYLIAIVAMSTIDARNSRKPLSAQDVEAFLEERAEAIGDEYGLTPREREILLHLSRGHSYASIADRLFISENTLRTHARNIYRKVGVGSREGLINLIHTNKE